jgi:hypothetical protein
MVSLPQRKEARGYQSRTRSDDKRIIFCSVDWAPHIAHNNVTANRRMQWSLRRNVSCFVFQFLGVGWDQVHLVHRSLTGLLYQPRMTDDECGAVGRMRIDRGNRSTRRKPAPAPHCPPQIPHDMSWARTLAATVGSRRLTAWGCILLLSRLSEPNVLSGHGMLLRVTDKCGVPYFLFFAYASAITGGLSPGVNRPKREADQSPPANAEVKKMWIYTSTPPYASMA